MHAGFARIDITPDPVREEVYNLGYWDRRNLRFLDVRDRIHVRATALGQGRERAFLIGVESIFDSFGFGTRATARLAAEFNIAPANIWIACTHAHSTPLIGLNQTDRGQAYGQAVEDAIVTAACVAAGRQIPVTATRASAAVPGIQYNRRPILNHGRVAELHTTPPPNQIADPGPVDDTLTVLRFHDGAGNLAGAWWHFAIHGVCVQCSESISGDCMGRAMQHVENLAPGAVVTFLNGACGDIDPARMGGTQQLDLTSASLSAALAKLLRARGKPAALAPVRATAGVYRAARRPVRTPAELESLRNAMRPPASAASDERHHGGDGYARFLLGEELALARSPAHVDIPFQIWRAGERLWIGVAGELFAATGQAIAAALAPQPVHVVGYAGGWLGYFPPEPAYAQGGYEVAPARWSTIAPGETETLVETLITTARSIS